MVEGVFPAGGRACPGAQGRGHSPFEEVKVVLGMAWIPRELGESE